MTSNVASGWSIRSERPLAWGIWEWLLTGPAGDRKLVWAPGQAQVGCELPSLLQPGTVLVPMRGLPVPPDATGPQVRKLVAAWVERLNADPEPAL